MMRTKFFAFLCILFFVSSCYIYKPFTEEEEDETTEVITNPKLKSASIKDGGVVSVREMKTEKPELKKADPQMADEQKRKEDEERKRREIEEMKRKETEEKGEIKSTLNASNEEEMKRKEMETEMKMKEIEAQKQEEERRMNIKAGKIGGGDVGKVSKEKESSEVKDIKEKLVANRYYKITANGKRLKVMATGWEGDTLNVHIIRKPQKALKFHKDQIDEETIEARHFSKPYSDIITIGSYIAAGFAVLLIVL